MLRAFVLALVALTLLCAGAPADSALRLTVLLSADTRGHLETCRCKHGQLGGIARRATAFLGAESPAPRLMLDAGNVAKGTSEYDKTKMEYILAGMWAMGYDAMNLGEREAALGLDTLKRLAAARQVPLISCNVVSARTGRYVVEPYRVVRVKDAKVAIVGVTDIPANGQVGMGLRVVAAEEALAKVLPSLRGKVDVIILLAAVDDARLESLAAKFPMLDLALGGDTRATWERAQLVGDVGVYAVGEHSGSVGRLTCTWQKGAGFKLVASQTLMLDPGVPDHPSFRQVVDAFRRGLDKTMQPRATKPALGLAGSDACQTCHAAAYQKWTTTHHGHAMDSLIRGGNQKDPECLSCHVTGLGAADGYVSMQRTPRLGNVGCEMCHGPARAHVSNPSIKPRLVAKTRCVSCHDPEHSDFDFNSFYPKIQH